MNLPLILLYTLYAASELNSLPPMAWIIRGILPMYGLAAFYGASGSGKSFLLLNLMAAIANGEDWFGRPTKKRRILYVVLEGAAGFRLRIVALAIANGKPIPESMKFMFNEFDLTKPSNVDALLSAIEREGGFDVVVIETLNQAAPGADENRSQDMGQILSACKRIQAFINGLVVLVHHTGKDASRGLRGHTSLPAALDVSIEVSRIGNRRIFNIAKLKDGDDSIGSEFELQIVDLGLDPDGYPLTSCVVKQVGTTLSLSQTPAPNSLGEHEQVAYDLFASRLPCEPGDRSSIPCLELNEAIKLIKPALNVKDEKRRGERAKAAVLSLVKNGHVGQAGDYLYLG